MKFVIYTFSIDGIIGRDMHVVDDDCPVCRVDITMYIDDKLIESGNWPKIVCECCADAQVRVTSYKIYQVRFCELCDTDMVVCPTCGNNCCNEGYGMVNDMPCQDCPMAYMLWCEHIQRDD